MRSKESLKKQVLKAIDDQADAIVAIGDSVWKNPESGYREVKTGKLAVKTLRGLGLATRDGLALTGARADLDSGRPGPVLALLGEMDALVIPSHPEADPVTGAAHACGHNTHIAGMLGAAMGLVKADAANDLAGKIAFITAPAEECIELDYRTKLIADGKIEFLGGKQQLIAEGVFDDVDLAAMIHVGCYNLPQFNGFVMKDITFHGKACHAASPGNGVNAMHAATLAINAIGLLRETFSGDATIRVHGIITDGGKAANIIPDTVRLEYQVRTNDLKKLNELSDRVDWALRGAAIALGAKVEINTLPGYLPMIESPAMTKLYHDAIKRHAPEAILPTPQFSGGSSDMGDVSQIVPAIHGGVPGCSGTGHGIDYKISDPVNACVGAAKILAMMAIDMLYGKATAAKDIMKEKDTKMSINDYLARLRSFAAHNTYGRDN
ncbi:amidohydrolase [Oligosphaera ethanolica]|uniref:Peptidase M20 domain-containing protein 2 n=1 Tax=Oligosphaera ethanolica TaxID=760260 RepID=A0AAE3VE44_9BACT|nr:amidohydrolase [Oligosphaera ethanolica]MDQ0288623.1 amidohydrolase [Oligosphaera ethanolica]